MAAHRITLIPGDGIGPEVTGAVLQVLSAAGVAIDWDRHEAGILALEQHKNPLPPSLIESIRRNKVALKGPVTTPIGEGFTSVNVGLRKALDLYVNLRPVYNIDGVPARFTNVDLVIIRENAEDLYARLEDLRARATGGIGGPHHIPPRRIGIVFRVRAVAAHEVRDVLASRRRRQGPQRRVDGRIIDAACMQLVLHPEFDVMVLPDLYGDIVWLCAGLVGGLGVVARPTSAPTRGVEPCTAARPTSPARASPTPALLLSAVLMLHHIGERAAADRIVHAVRSVMAAGASLTPDLGGRASTREFADAVCKML